MGAARRMRCEQFRLFRALWLLPPDNCVTDETTMRKGVKVGFHVGNARATTYPSEAFVYFALAHLMAHEIYKAYIAERLVQLFGDSLFVCFKVICLCASKSSKNGLKFTSGTGESESVFDGIAGCDRERRPRSSDHDQHLRLNFISPHLFSPRQLHILRFRPSDLNCFRRP